MWKIEELSGMKVTVMGLGLNGGGLESARFFAGRGAVVTVTDLRDERALAASLRALFPIHPRELFLVLRPLFCSVASASP